MSKAKIHYHDIGDYLSREDKLAIVKKARSVEKMEWIELMPNEHGDWISIRNDAFSTFIPLEPEKKFDLKTQSVFVTYSLGLCTNRDAWCYNSSKQNLQKNIEVSLNFYNQQRLDFANARSQDYKINFDDFIIYDSSKLNWTDTVKRDAEKNIKYDFEDGCIVQGLYRPFFKQRVYFSNNLNHRVYQQPKLFPKPHLSNIVICLTGMGASKDFSVLLTDSIPNLDTLEKAQCFPLYFYEERQKQSRSLFDDNSGSDYIRRDGVSDFILERAKKQYGRNVSKEDIFYYIYGFLHSPEYRETFAADLKKMLPRLPLVDDVRDFWAFSKAGHKLAELHLNYETVAPYPDVMVTGDDSGFFTVEKMRFPKKGQTDTIIYNSKITISNIPTEAYEYAVNGKSAIEWIMERYQVTIHKDSGIKNDPNDWATEHNQPRYILDLLLSIINVSVQTVKIVNELPKMKFE